MGERVKEKEECQKGKEKREERDSLLIKWQARFFSAHILRQRLSLSRTLQHSQKHKAEVDKDTGFQSLWFAMAQGSDSNDTSYKSPSPGSRQSSSDDAKKVMRREKNRIAAQKSRMRQTQKADSLHLESENLEKENAALRKEVKQLTEEAKYLSSVLSSHEPLCTGLAPQTPDLLYPPHHSSYHQHISVPHYQH
ncbi:basic leucine zipper transcriptional factor ATF-like [Odontesthes bonariensis]|uniref:basic leucine zipper transcriptional factor ATF-like n=1 Tax=Odontesthes bonariensis TaxID=219752 RepID=UPI003F5829C2